MEQSNHNSSLRGTTIYADESISTGSAVRHPEMPESLLHSPFSPTQSHTVQTGGNFESFTVQSHGVTTVTADDLMPQDGGLLSTARNLGSPAMGDLKPSTTVNYQGLEVSLEVLETMGIVSRNPVTGLYGVTGGAGSLSNQQDYTGNQQQQQLPTDNQQQQETKPDFFPAEMEATLHRAIEGVPSHVQDGLMSDVLANGLSALNLQRHADNAGMKLEDFSQRANFVINAFTSQVNHLAGSMNIDNPQACWDWAEKNIPQRLAAARAELVAGRSLAGIKQVIEAYQKSVPFDAKTYQNNGIPTKQGSNGETLIFIGGMWMTTETAAYAGLVR